MSRRARRALHRWICLGFMCGVAARHSTAQTAAMRQAQDPWAPRESLLAAERNVSDAAWRAGFVDGLSPALGRDGVLLFPGAPIVAGSEAARRLLGGVPELASLRVEWRALAAHVSGDGTLGVTYGVTTIVDAPPDRAGPRHARYISVWRRQARGGEGGWALAAHVQTSVLQRAVPFDAARWVAAPAQMQGGAGAPFAAADVAFARMAADSGAPSAFAAFAAPFAVTFAGTGELNVGPAAIRARMEANGAQRSAWVWAPRLAGASDDGELGWTVGEATITAPGEGTARTFHSKYLTAWRRMADGTIRFLVDGGNARPEERR